MPVRVRAAVSHPPLSSLWGVHAPPGPTGLGDRHREGWGLAQGHSPQWTEVSPPSSRPAPAASKDHHLFWAVLSTVLAGAGGNRSPSRRSGLGDRSEHWGRGPDRTEQFVQGRTCVAFPAEGAGAKAKGGEEEGTVRKEQEAPGGSGLRWKGGQRERKTVGVLCRSAPQDAQQDVCVDCTAAEKSCGRLSWAAVGSETCQGCLPACLSACLALKHIGARARWCQSGSRHDGARPASSLWCLAGLAQTCSGVGCVGCSVLTALAQTHYTQRPGRVAQ